jgi:RND family efflux transporter MFP subunit
MTQALVTAPPESEPQQSPPATPSGQRTRSGRRLLWAGLGIALSAAGFFVFRTITGGAQHSGGENATTIMAVARAGREDLAQDLLLTAEFHPFQEVSLHAKVAGYLKSISVDVGDQVTSGQKIAELEIPELGEDLARATSAYKASLEDVKKAEADAEQTGLIYQRLLNVSKDHPKLVAQQELDDAKAKDNAMKGALGAARQRVDERQSDVDRTRTLLDYSSIIVPFGGIITRRYADVGALIQAGISSNTQALPVVDLAQQDLLRLIFPVPESAAPLVHNGAPVEVTVSALNQTFRGKIARFSGKVDRSTRTMHTEVDVPNPDNRFAPGMYAFVRMILREEKNTLAVPVEALIDGPKPKVFVVTKDGTVEEREVSTGLATPDKVQITKGIEEGDLVITGNRKGVRPGQKVVAKITELPKAG